MSNLQKPPHSVAYLRLRHPRFWRYLQEHFTKVLDKPAPMIAQMMARLGREGTLEALEASFDAGTMKFICCPENPNIFGLAFYCVDADRYFVLTEGGTLHDTAEGMPNWSLGEDDDGD
jgi:hypothetical protein